MIDQGSILLFITVAVASAVEGVEALTIILASGITRGWRSTLEGVAAGVACLTVIVVVVGTALINYVPLPVLRVVVGTLLLIFGLQWLTKAVLRETGFKAQHDERDIYCKEVEVLSKEKGILRGRRDSLAFVVSFKGVFLEGMEVIMIVISFGLASGNHSQLEIAAIGAIVAVGIVFLAGAIVAKPLTKVPENIMKLGVGILLTVFGLFWMGEGAGVEWPFGDVFLLVLLLIIFLWTLGLVAYFRLAHEKRKEAKHNVQS